MRFFRGIAVPAVVANDVISSISCRGLDREGAKVYTWQKPTDPERLFQKQDLSRNDTQGPRESAPMGLCACSDELSAAVYAWERNKSAKDDTPILIEIEADPEAVAIDGNDFLYPAFQLGNAEQFRNPLKRLFGEKILRYAQAAWNSNDTNKRLALCDLAIHDRDVIVGHYENKLVIGGRYYTKFRNSFMIRLPIGPASIIDVWTPTSFSTLPEIDLNFYEIMR